MDATAVYVSAASIFEMAVKMRAGKLRLRVGARQRLSTLIADTGFEELPVRAEHAALIPELPLVHDDPFDQLRREGLAVVTADATFAAYGVGSTRRRSVARLVARPSLS